MLLIGVHGQLAALTASPELALTPVQAKMLADAAAKVAAFYPGAVLSPVQAAWFNLGQIALVIYGPKVFAIRERRAKTRKNARAVADAQSVADELGGGAFDAMGNA